jgi:hypothetical protein
LSNIFLGTKEPLDLDVGYTSRSLPLGTLYTPSDEDDAEMYFDNYLVTGHSGNYPHIHIFKNTKNGYELIVKEYIPDWKYTPVDWSKEESIGTEYSLELFNKIIKNIF